MRVIFFGTPDFAASVLEYLIKNSPHDIVGVVSKPDAPKGRGRQLTSTPVKKVSEELLPNVPIFQPEKASSPDVVEELRLLKPDVCIVVAYGEIIRQSLLDIAKNGFFNTHASLLPSYRGAAPIQRALMDGCDKTGITIFRLNKGMDSGDIVWQQSCQVGSEMNAGELTEKLLSIASLGVVEVLDQLEADAIKYVPQHHEEATLAPKIAPMDQVLEWQNDVFSLHDRIRALSPHPGAFFNIICRDLPMRLKVLKTHVDQTICSPHRRWAEMDDGSLALITPDGALVLDLVQPEGKKSMSSDSFLRGTPLHLLFFH